MAESDINIDYPSMTRQREDNIQQNMIARADDVNAEFNNIVTTYNRLVALLQGEFSTTGRLYELIDKAVQAAGTAETAVKTAVKKSGDTMEGQLMTMLEPTSEYSMVNKKYVDNVLNTTVGPVNTVVKDLKTRLDSLDATQVKLANGNFTSNTVDGGMSELFLSVSSGKAAIADAITDKGIETSATAKFTEMQEHINNIITFIDGTANGTITPDKVLKGYIGYSKGQAIIGTHECDSTEILKQADPLIPDNIAEGKKALGYNGLVVGTHKCSSGGTVYPTYGTDTSDGTATAGDILKGKVAYSKGVRIVGKLSQVEEITKYSLNKSSSTNFNILPNAIQDEDGKTYYIFENVFAKDYSAVVRVGVHYNEDTGAFEDLAIFSNRMDNLEPVIITSNGSPKKYKYTAEDLGLTSINNVAAIWITPGGAYGNDRLAHLIIWELPKEVWDTSNNYVSGQTYTINDKQVSWKDLGYTIHIYPYHLTDNCVIGTLPGENFNVSHIKASEVKGINNYVAPVYIADSRYTYYYYVKTYNAGINNVANEYNTMINNYGKGITVRDSNTKYASGVMNTNAHYIICTNMPYSPASFNSSYNNTIVLYIDLRAELVANRLTLRCSIPPIYDSMYRNYCSFMKITDDDKALLTRVYNNSYGTAVAMFTSDDFSEYKIYTAANNVYSPFDMYNSSYYRYGSVNLSTNNFIYISGKNITFDYHDLQFYKYTINTSTNKLEASIQIGDTISQLKEQGIMSSSRKGSTYIVDAVWVTESIVAVITGRGDGKITDTNSSYPTVLYVIQVQPDGTIVSGTGVILTSHGNSGASNNFDKSRIDYFGAGLQAVYVDKEIDGINYNIKLVCMLEYSTSPVNGSPILTEVYVGTKEDELVAIRYKDKVFFASAIQGLTAGQPDVAAGKTFIGYMGYPEVGTKEE